MTKPGATQALLEKIAAHPSALLVLDFDGTLVPIRAKSDLVLITAAQRELLARLNRGRLRVAVLSGRALWDVRARIGIPDAIYGGVFGLEMAGPGLRYAHPRARASRRALIRLAAELRKTYTDFPGAWVEEKGLGLSLHHRGVPPARKREFMRRLALFRDRERGWVWELGKRVWEVTPAIDWDKGRATLFLWRRLGRPYLFAVGDEPADEPMLKAARSKGGASAHVGGGKTGAEHRFRNPASVHRFLRALAERVESGPAATP